MAQDPDSLAAEQHVLIQETIRFIRMAQDDRVINSRQADSLQGIIAGYIEKPFENGIDVIMQIRDAIDSGYEKQLKEMNEYALGQHIYSARSMLPAKLGIPDDIVSREQIAADRQALGLQQMSESLARDFERQKIPKWQLWWRKYLRMFFGDRACLKGEVTCINGQKYAVPRRDDR